ncbi:MAG: hypothetical protein IKH64_06075 [Prevotella sp.]|nr:hypothetical protein [Prevotella sp.]
MKKILILFLLFAGVEMQAQTNNETVKKLENAINKLVNGNKQSTDKTANPAASQPTRTIVISSKPTTMNRPATTQQTTQQAVSPQAATAADVLTIDNLGIGGIKLGMKMNSVPKTVPGLYARYSETSMGESGVEYNCLNAQGDIVMQIDDENEDGLVDRLYIMVKGAKIANTGIQIGVPFSKVVNTPGLKKTKDEYGNELYLYNKRYEVQEDMDHIVYAILVN